MIAIKIIDEKGNEIFNGAVTELPLKEEYIIAKSIERFNESEPCIIYRTHIQKIFYLELYEKIERFKDSNIYKIMCTEINDFFDNVSLDTNEALVYIH